MPGSKKPKVLTKLELAIMRVVWEAAPAALTVRDIGELLNAERPQTPLAYTTVQTMLRILKDKNIIRSEALEGRAHTFVASVSRDDVTTSMVGDLVERLFDGSAPPLFAHLLGHESIGKEELEELRALIDRHLSGSNDEEESS